MKDKYKASSEFYYQNLQITFISYDFTSALLSILLTDVFIYIYSHHFETESQHTINQRHRFFKFIKQMEKKLCSLFIIVIIVISLIIMKVVQTIVVT